MKSRRSQRRFSSSARRFHAIVPALAIPEAKAAVTQAVASWREAIEPCAAEHTYMNFAESRREPRSLFSETAYHRLRRVKAPTTRPT